MCEFLGSGSLFGFKIMSFSIGMFSTPAGAFIIYGLSIALFTYILDVFMRNRRVKENRLARENLLDMNPDGGAAAEAAKEV